MKFSSKIRLYYLSRQLASVPIDRLYFNQNENYLWASNPKCASTSMLKNFVRQSRNKSIPTTRDQVFETHGLFRFSVEEINHILCQTPSFCVVRNPYQRLISAYFNKIDRHQKNVTLATKRKKTDTTRVSVTTARLERDGFVSNVFEGDFEDTTSKAGSPFCSADRNIEA